MTDKEKIETENYLKVNEKKLNDKMPFAWEI